MKILLCHNYYQQPGGEDESYAAEARLLRSRGHEVLEFTRHNDEIHTLNPLSLSIQTLWNRTTYRELRAMIRRHRPQIMHCTNTFPLISPAAYSAARAEGVPVVQSLRNFRLLCLNGLFLRDGRVCEDCAGRSVWRGVARGCYRQDLAASGVVASMLQLHRLLKTWARSVTLYFTPSEFARQKLVAGGMPPERILVKPNFVDPDPGLGAGRGEYAMFAGRLSVEKGIETLLSAWRLLPAATSLKIVGDGPLAPAVQAAAAADNRIQWLGRRPLPDVLDLLGDAAFLVMPSVWYETFGRTIVEAYAKGTPVIASRLGAMSELVLEGKTGLLAEPGDARDLASKAMRLLAEPGLRAPMRTAAREEYESKYMADANHQLLMHIYQRALSLGSPVSATAAADAMQAALR